MKNEYCERCPYWTIPEGIPDAEPDCMYMLSGFVADKMHCLDDLGYYSLKMHDIFYCRMDTEGIDTACNNVKLWLQCEYQADRIVYRGTYLTLCNMADDIAADLKARRRELGLNVRPRKFCYVKLFIVGFIVLFISVLFAQPLSFWIFSLDIGISWMLLIGIFASVVWGIFVGSITYLILQLRRNRHE